MTFSYIRTLNSIPDKKVKSITFDISRYGKHTHCISFAEPVFIDKAIYEVERFLSVPLDDEYYNQVKDDLFHTIRHYYQVRGDCLSDLKFLEDIKEIEQGVFTLLCGS
jgi:hypothetical protein